MGPSPSSDNSPELGMALGWLDMEAGSIEVSPGLQLGLPGTKCSSPTKVEAGGKEAPSCLFISEGSQCKGSRTRRWNEEE